MRGIPLLFTVAAFLAGVGIALTARSGRVLASEQSDTHAADRAGVEKLHRADRDECALVGRWRKSADARCANGRNRRAQRVLALTPAESKLTDLPSPNPFRINTYENKG